jgi:CheY-like chemotaxis protein
MPGMLGEDTISQLRAIRADIPIIASSGYHENEAIRRFGAGISGFVQKPYTARQLAVALRRALP